MSSPDLKTVLKPIVRQYGLGTVLKHLGQLAEAQDEEAATSGRTKARRGKRRVTAPEYVRKLDLSSQRAKVLHALATKFEEKSFLPRFRDIADFCETYEVAVPASTGRAGAVPRVFKALAAMDLAEVQRILDDDMFAGPSRLKPLADAIHSYHNPSGSMPLEHSHSDSPHDNLPAQLANVERDREC